MELNNKWLLKLMFAVEATGAALVSIFLAAFLGGMFMTPSTTVLHSNIAFRIPLIIFGGALLIFILTTVVIAAFEKKN